MEKVQRRALSWSSMINNQFLKGITNVDLVSFFFPAKLEFRVNTNLNKSLLQMHICILTQNQLSTKKQLQITACLFSIFHKPRPLQGVSTALL